MRTTNEKLRSLSSNSVWLFTKQETDFDESFKAACLFDGIPDRENTNIEAYFTANHSRYGIRTDRHRILVIPQLFGLITKTPFYAKGPRYNEERPTAVFDALKAAAQRGKEYNIIKTEQVLKLKIHAIIDTADNNMGHAVLPVIFIYRVLKELKEKYHISRVPIDLLYTYVMTCRDYSEAEDAVGYIRENAPASEYVGEFKSRSRVLTCIKKNISLFRIDSNYISIDPRFDAYFDKNFMQKFDVEGMHAQLARDVDYAYFLYDLQGFGVDLVGEAPPSLLSAQPLLPLTPTDTAETEEGEDTDDTDDTDDPEYAEKVDGIRETNINEAAGRRVPMGVFIVRPCRCEGVRVGTFIVAGGALVADKGVLCLCGDFCRMLAGRLVPMVVGVALPCRGEGMRMLGGSGLAACGKAEDAPESETDRQDEGTEFECLFHNFSPNDFLFFAPFSLGAEGLGWTAFEGIPRHALTRGSG